MTRLEDVVRDLERHAAATGWDAPPRLYALVAAPELNRNEPELARQLGVPDEPDGIAALEQPDLPLDRPIEDVLHGIEWPGQVAGCALILERILLPEGAEEEAPDDDPVTWAARHPGREDVRLVVGVLRDGSRYSAMRLRGHDSDDEVLTGPELVPHLTDALASTLS
ncbi:PPA1309 family protein [Actinoallomurus sp. NPDC052308]|uniref:PPA1309 family protein n=1 Tax=Actinoallomurus sp. NPDC052308 TaxID=3155530 RepID=UPI0034263BB8